MYTGVLATCMSVYLVQAWYPLRSEEGVESPGTGRQGASAGSQGKKKNNKKQNVIEERLLLRCYYGNTGFLTFILPDERIKDESRDCLIYSHGTSMKEGESGISCFYLYLRKYKSE